MILNGKPINPGRLRTPVNLGTRVITETPGGWQQVSYTAFARVLAEWTNVHGSETWQASALQAEQPATVLIRYDARLEPTGAIRKAAQWYEIVSLDDIGERHEWIECKVRRVRSG